MNRAIGAYAEGPAAHAWPWSPGPVSRGRRAAVVFAVFAAKSPDQGVSWDCTTWLNLVFLSLAAALIIRFVRTGGAAMLRMMGGSPQDHTDPHVSHTH